MFLHELGTNYSGSETLSFHKGMNILAVEHAQESKDIDSRTCADKINLARMLRYLLGEKITKRNLPKIDAPEGFSFTASFTLPDGTFHVERPLHPMTQIKIVSLSDKSSGSVDMTCNQPIQIWKELVGVAYGLTGRMDNPTLGDLISQTIRTEFNNPIKTEAHSSNWQAGIRLGYFLGLSPSKLNSVKSVKTLKRKQNNIKKAVNDGALPGMSLDAEMIRYELKKVQKQRSRMSAELKHFKVEEQYRDQQEKADEISQQIQAINEEMLALRKRMGDLRRAMVNNATDEGQFKSDAGRRVKDLYQEIQIDLPGSIIQRYEDVLTFHESVVKNRRMFLRSEYRSVREQLEKDSNKIASLDAQRASVMEILSSNVALETFQKVQQEIQNLNEQINTLNTELKLAYNLKENQEDVKKKAAVAQCELHQDLLSQDNNKRVAAVINQFSELGNEIYHDRAVNLSIHAAADGLLYVSPSISDDSSAGTKHVEMFLLDMVFLSNAMELGRSPRFIFHDSRLFDSMDSRELGLCLNIGARLAEQIGFQYVVTVNSENLRNAKGFENKEEYQVQLKHTRYGESW